MKKLQGDKMSRPKGDMRVKQITVMVSEAEKKEIQAKANELGQSISEFIRRGADEHYALATGEIEVHSQSGKRNLDDKKVTVHSQAGTRTLDQTKRGAGGPVAHRGVADSKDYKK